MAQISVDPTRDATWHADVGAALAPLRDENVLIVGSGSVRAGLRDLHGPWLLETPTLVDILGPVFVKTFLDYKRDELERCSRWVTDWEFREYAYHL